MVSPPTILPFRMNIQSEMSASVNRATSPAFLPGRSRGALANRPE